MILPQGVLDFLNESARRARVPPPGADADLFKAGVLDSFALIDFIAVLEEQCGIRVPDPDVNALNFQSLNAIAAYVESRKG